MYDNTSFKPAKTHTRKFTHLACQQRYVLVGATLRTIDRAW